MVVLETLKPVLRAAAISAIAVGILLLLLNPPSMSRFSEKGLSLYLEL